MIVGVRSFCLMSDQSAFVHHHIWNGNVYATKAHGYVTKSKALSLYGNLERTNGLAILLVGVRSPLTGPRTLVGAQDPRPAPRGAPGCAHAPPSPPPRAVSPCPSDPAAGPVSGSPQPCPASGGLRQARCPSPWLGLPRCPRLTRAWLGLGWALGAGPHHHPPGTPGAPGPRELPTPAVP